MDKQNLDSHIAAYQPDFAHDLDNRLILADYPLRVLKLCPRHDSLLELGLGHGTATRIFADHVKHHVVIDGSPAIIQKFRSENPGFLKVDLVESWFETFDTDERFDLICMGFVLEHVVNPNILLERYKRFLKSGGSLAVSVPNGEALHRRIGNAAGILPDIMALGTGDEALGHKRVYSVVVLERLLEECGYRLRAMEGLFLKPITTKQLLTLDLPESILRAMMTVGRGYPELCAGLLAIAEVA
jgi:SAM-dependent methyltransferase